MATVPIIQDSASLQVDTGRQRVEAQASAFGSQEARGLAILAGGVDSIAKAAEEADARFDEADAAEGDIETMDRLRVVLYDPENGYLTGTRGRRRSALDNRATVEQEIQGIAEDVISRRRSPRAQQLLQSTIRRRVADALGDVATHASRELNTYQNEVSESRLMGFVNNAVAAYGDPAAVSAQIAGATGEVQRLAERNGWDSQVRDQRIRDIQSDINTRVISQLAVSDPSAAEAMYASIRPNLNAQHAGELLTTMRSAQREHVERIEGMGWQAFANGQPLSSLPAPAYEQLTSNPILGQSHARLRDAYRVRAESFARGERTQNDSPAYWGLRVLSQTDPQRFMETLPQVLASQEGATISRGDTGRLLEMYVQIQQGADVGQQRTVFNGVVDTATTALSPYGFDTGEESEDGIALRAALLREVERFMASSGGAAPNSDQTREIIGRAVVSLPRSVAPDSVQVRGDRGRAGARNERRRTGSSIEPPTGGVVVPFDAIPPDDRAVMIERLQPRLRRMPTRGEIENAYARYLAGERVEFR